MGWTVDTDLAGHLRAVEGFLAADPVERTTQATVLASLTAGMRWSDEPTVFAVHRDAAGRVAGSAVHTPPFPLLLDGAHDPADLAARLGSRELDGVNAPEPVAEAFAAAWCGPRGKAARPDLRLHLLDLPELADLVEPPAPAAVSVRPATPADLPAVVELVAAMRVETREPGSSPAELHRNRIAAGLLFVVDTGGGTLLATAQATPAVAGVSRVAGVYTVPAARGRGLAAAVTAAVTRAAFAAGARQLCLFTDAANPTSNGVYERLGYRRRPHDRVVLRLR